MKKYIIIFVLAVGIFTVTKMPANILQNNFPDFIINGKIIEGGAWHKDYGLIEWKLLPLRLFTGNLSFDVNLTKNNTNVKSVASIDILTNKKLRETKGVVEIDYIRKFTPQIPEFIKSNIVINNIDIDLAELQPQMPVKVIADLSAENLFVMGETIGSYNLGVNLEDGELTATLINQENAMFNTDIKAVLEDNKVIISGDVNGKDSSAAGLLAALNIDNKVRFVINLD